MKKIFCVIILLFISACAYNHGYEMTLNNKSDIQGLKNKKIVVISADKSIDGKRLERRFSQILERQGAIVQFVQSNKKNDYVVGLDIYHKSKDILTHSSYNQMIGGYNYTSYVPRTETLQYTCFYLDIYKANPKTQLAEDTVFTSKLCTHDLVSKDEFYTIINDVYSNGIDYYDKQQNLVCDYEGSLICR
nr:MAG TPA: TRAF PROTEIN, TRAO PROTEIN, TRAN ADHESION, BACTERIAL SECRETION.5A [Bacteriophage sp.]